MTSRIIRLRNRALRVPCWSLWFPLVLAGRIARTILTGHAERLLCRSYWRLQLAVYVIGVDGMIR